MADVLGIVTTVCGMINEAHFWFNGRGFSLRDGLSPFKTLALELKLFATLWQIIETYIDGHYVDLQPGLANDLEVIRRDMAIVLQDVQDSVHNARDVDLQQLQQAHNGPLFAFQDPKAIRTEREEQWRALFREQREVRQRQLLNYCTMTLNAILQVVNYTSNPFSPSKQSNAAEAIDKFNHGRQRLANVEQTGLMTDGLQMHASIDWLRRTTSFPNGGSTTDQVQDLSEAWIAHRPASLSPASHLDRVVSVLQEQIRRLQRDHATALEENEAISQENEAIIQRNEDLLARGFEWKNRSDRHEADVAALNQQLQDSRMAEYTLRQTQLQYQREQAPMLNQISQLEASNITRQEQIDDLQHELAALQDQFDTMRAAQAQDQHRESHLLHRKRDLEADNAARLRQIQHLERENTILQARVEELETAVNRFSATQQANAALQAQVQNLEANLARIVAAQTETNGERRARRRERSVRRDPSRHELPVDPRVDAQNDFLQAQLRTLQATVEQQGRDHALQLTDLREELERERTRRQYLEDRLRRDRQNRRNARAERPRKDGQPTRAGARKIDRRRPKETRTGFIGFIESLFGG